MEWVQGWWQWRNDIGGGGLSWRTEKKIAENSCCQADYNDFIGLFWCLGCCGKDRIGCRACLCNSLICCNSRKPKMNFLIFKFWSDLRLIFKASRFHISLFSHRRIIIHVSHDQSATNGEDKPKKKKNGILANCPGWWTVEVIIGDADFTVTLFIVGFLKSLPTSVEVGNSDADFNWKKLDNSFAEFV